MTVERRSDYDDILLFLWRWKVASTAALSARYFSDLVPHSAYKKLLYLAKKEFVEAKCDGYGEDFLWALTRKGFERVKSRLNVLREDGFKSEHPDHDYLVTAVHLGDDLFRSQEPLESFTEQELRRYDHNFFPKWVPISSLHRPDGYWRICMGAKSKVMALEVELTSKHDCDYHGIAKFYARHETIERVVWFCPNESMAKRLNRLVREPEEVPENQHSFFLVPDFECSGWGALCKAGADLGQSLHSILGRATGNTQGTGWERVPQALLCDRRKRHTAYEEFYCRQKSQAH